jgi:ferrochelatase
MKKGILLVNLGTPDAPDRPAVYRYLKQFLLDPRVIDTPWLSRNLLVRGIIAPFRSANSSKLYQKLWTENGSPLKYYGDQVTKGLRVLLGENYAVELAMRYQNPSIESGIEKLLQQQVAEITVFPMFPQYASASTGSVYEEVMRVLQNKNAIPTLKFINSFYDYAPMIDIFANNARQFDIDNFDHIIFSYHGLPERQLKKTDRFNHCLQSKDCCQTITGANQFCYSAQCYATTRAIAAKLNLTPDRYTTSFQSRLGKTPWVQPYTTDVLKAQAERGAKRLLMFSPAFVADCLETLIEISDEYHHEFQEMGGELVQLVPSLNDNPKWIAAVRDLVA